MVERILFLLDNDNKKELWSALVRAKVTKTIACLVIPRDIRHSGSVMIFVETMRTEIAEYHSVQTLRRKQ